MAHQTIIVARTQRDSSAGSPFPRVSRKDVLQARSERGSDTRLFNFQFSKQKMAMRLTSRAVSDLQ